VGGMVFPVLRQRYHGSKQPVLLASPEWTIFGTILVNFREFRTGEVRRTPLLGSS
jgi:hypothetical protein